MRLLLPLYKSVCCSVDSYRDSNRILFSLLYPAPFLLIHTFLSKDLDAFSVSSLMTNVFLLLLRYVIPVGQCTSHFSLFGAQAQFHINRAASSYYASGSICNVAVIYSYPLIFRINHAASFCCVPDSYAKWL